MFWSKLLSLDDCTGSNHNQISPTSLSLSTMTEVDRWTPDRFQQELEAWRLCLRDDPQVPQEVAAEFSQWSWRKGYLARRYDGLEVHIVFSVVHGCPMLIINSRQEPKLGSGFVGSFEYHPVTDEVCFTIHACEVRSMMAFLDLHEKAAGVGLLSWWSVMANAALSLSFDPSIFAKAKRALERPATKGG
jgi:hypothetical protein